MIFSQFTVKRPSLSSAPFTFTPSAIVNDLENMSISALKNKKLDIRKTMLSSVIEAKKEIEKRLKK